MNRHTSGCCVCGKELVYHDREVQLQCVYCGETFSSQATCVDNHYVCDQCHAMAANDVIEQFCRQSTETDALAMAFRLLNHPAVNMHGPEHHFLVPAVLLAAYYNLQNKPAEKVEKLVQARNRAAQVPGGACGYMGSCGAAIGAGIFMSLVQDTSPLSKESWSQVNETTGKCLLRIAAHGGPRCCKRNIFLAISQVLNILGMPVSRSITCTFSARNKQCLTRECPYFQEHRT